MKAVLFSLRDEHVAFIHIKVNYKVDLIKCNLKYTKSISCVSAEAAWTEMNINFTNIYISDDCTSDCLSLMFCEHKTQENLLNRNGFLLKGCLFIAF